MLEFLWCTGAKREEIVKWRIKDLGSDGKVTLDKSYTKRKKTRYVFLKGKPLERLRTFIEC